MVNHSPAARPVARRPACTGVAKHTIDQLAAQIAHKLDLHPGDPLDPVVRRLGGRIITDPSGAPEKTGSLTVRAGRGFTIHISPFTGPYRQRFTIAHELGHFFLHAEAGRRSLEIDRFGSDRVEWEANWFAAGFLLPEDDFVAAWHRTSGSIPLLVSEFQVSPGVIEIRRETLRSWGCEI